MEIKKISKVERIDYKKIFLCYNSSRKRNYIVGDTDITEKNKKIKCDVAYVPFSGTYTMDFKEAANLINEIKLEIAVPTHYGDIIGINKDATDFIKLLHQTIKSVILKS